jgi:hypothetical protein
MNSLEFIASLVNSLVWPAAILIIVLVLRSPIARVLGRTGLRRVKAGPGGVEFEWDRALEEAQTELEEEKKELVPSAAPPEEELGFLDEMRQLARISPEAAVLESYRRLEQEVRPPLEARVPPPSQRRRWGSLYGAAREAATAGILEERDVGLLRDLSALRNAVAHEKVELDEERALNYADLAWDAARTLMARLGGNERVE